MKLIKKMMTILTFGSVFFACACSCSKVGETSQTSKAYDEYLENVKAYVDHTSYTRVPLFGTVISYRYFDTKNEEVDSYIKSEFLRMHQLFDRHYYYKNENGDFINNLRVINESVGEDVVVDTDLIEILKVGVEYTKLSQGKFNIAVGSLSSLWDSYIDEYQFEDITEAPSQLEIERAKSCTPSYTQIDDVIVINEGNHTVRLNNIAGCEDQVSITLGALAKSYAVDKITSSNLIKDGNYLFNAGMSTIKLLGENLSKQSRTWSVGVHDSYLKYSREQSFSSFIIRTDGDISISTSSGDERHYRYIDSSNVAHYYYHIIDPISGYPVESNLAVSAFCDDAMLADIVTTTMMTMTLEEMQTYLELIRVDKDSSLEVLVQRLDNNNPKFLVTSGLKNEVSINQDDTLSEYLSSITIEDF